MTLLMVFASREIIARNFYREYIEKNKITDGRLYYVSDYHQLFGLRNMTLHIVHAQHHPHYQRILDEARARELEVIHHDY